MRIMLFIIIISFPVASSQAQDYAIGADLSFLKLSEDNGFEFKENGKPKAGLEIFRDHGYNWIRLRLFHTPDRLPNNLNYTISLAREAKEMGYRFLLDFHYSDTWADPAKQYLPKAWENLPVEKLPDVVYATPGKRGADGMRIMAIETNKMFSFTWNAPLNIPDIRKQRTLVVIKLEEIEGKTKVRLEHIGWGDGKEWDKAFNYFANAWKSEVLPRLLYRFKVGRVDWNNPPMKKQKK